MSETLSDFRLKCIYALPSKVTRQDVLSMIEEITRLRHPASAGSEEAALRRENEDLKAFIRGIGINCQRAAETLSQVAASAALPPTPKDESVGK